MNQNSIKFFTTTNNNNINLKNFEPFLFLILQEINIYSNVQIVIILLIKLLILINIKIYVLKNIKMLYQQISNFLKLTKQMKKVKMVL